MYHNPPLHPDFTRIDGDIFFLIFNAGRSTYKNPIDDPMYSAHFFQTELGYWLDYEYTAMACFEQHQMCISGNLSTCTQYGSLIQAKWLINDYARLLRDEDTLEELQAFNEVFHATTVWEFVARRGASAPLLSRSYSWDTWYVPIDPLEQWGHDVQSWFEGSFLLFRVYMQLQSMISGEDHVHLSLKRSYMRSFVGMSYSWKATIPISTSWASSDSHRNRRCICV
jgi:hypothetical protein